MPERDADDSMTTDQHGDGYEQARERDANTDELPFARQAPRERWGC